MNTTTPPADVLVVGAGGVFGWPAIRLLLDRGVVVRGICRHPEAAADLASAGAEIVAGDLIDRASIERALSVRSGCVAAHSLPGRGRWATRPSTKAGIVQRSTLSERPASNDASARRR